MCIGPPIALVGEDALPDEYRISPRYTKPSVGDDRADLVPAWGERSRKLSIDSAPECISHRAMEDGPGRRTVRYAGAFAVLVTAGAVQLLFPQLPPFVVLYPAVAVCAVLGGVAAGVLGVLAALAFAVARTAATAWPPDAWALAALLAFALGGSILVAVVAAYQRASSYFRHERQRLKAALQAANAAVWEIDANGKLTWDENFYRLVGLEPHTTPPTTEAFLAMVNADDRSKMAAAREAIDAGLPPRPIDEYRLHRPDGTTVWLENHRSRGADGGRHYIGITQDITRRKQAEERIVVLLREAAHRAKNQFAVIQAIARETARGSDVGDAFYQAFVARIHALAKTHDLLVKGDWHRTTLHELLTAHWAPFGVEERCKVDGAPISVSAAAAQQLGLAFHELTTNAIKHGALADSGTVLVTWTIAEEQFHLKWVESGVGKKPEFASRGFGSRVLTTIVASALLGESNLSAAEQGLIWSLKAPLTSIEASGPKPDPTFTTG
jgi:PAS domain S-box-containing protein